MAMAGNDDDKFDMEGHKKTFQGFTRLLTWSTAVIVVVLALMALLLV
ncbi:MAG: aa3-type cytochrome c oxidase subunit IV [Rhodovibrio sp.]|nr:aa3-type cytochrome c oxidase subunit IV [Rhodovibrio sp.]